MSVPRSLSPVLRAAIVLSMLTAVLLFPQMSRAAGFNTCIVPQQGLAVRQGVERPLSRDFDKVCVAVLPPTCRNFTEGGQPCAYRACLVTNEVKRCPNGDMVVFTAMVIKPVTARTIRPFTDAERAAMNHAIDAEAKALADKWTDHGRVPLAPEALTVLQNIACLSAASANPDVRCVPR